RNYLKMFQYKNILNEKFTQNQVVSNDEIESYIMLDEYNKVIEGEMTSSNQSSSELVSELKNLATISFFRNPVKKYKTYKTMLKKFQTLEG
ncbi:MAG: hypothetical protein AB7E37_08565, partial [Candidatus Altimarinota bacterium]